MIRFTLVALTCDGSLEGSSLPPFTLGSERPLTSRSHEPFLSATVGLSIIEPLCFQLSHFNPEIANRLFCAFSRCCPPALLPACPDLVGATRH